MSGMVEKVKAKVDNVLHKDKTSDPSGPHDSHTANKADPRVDSDHVGSTGNVGSAAHGTTHTGTHTGAHTGVTGTHTSSTGYSDPTGPHDSHLANKADPRVDSDRVGTAGNYGSATHGATTHGTHTGAHTGTHTGVTGTHAGSDPTGPHDSHLANKADPRVDSDRYGAAGNVGSAGYSDPTGPHSSHLANQADPRVGGIGSTTHGTTGTTGTHTGLTGTHTTSTGYSDPRGPHDSHLANKADPRVDSDRVGTATHGTHTGTTGTGMTGTHIGSTGSDPRGPHDSHLANKLDPRVDSDRAGTGNVGTGNLAHRENETGDLPKALVEPQSHAVPHSSVQTGHHTTGTHGTTGVHGTHGTTDVHGKPSMMDKLNPKKDADHDGKAGIMD